MEELTWGEIIKGEEEKYLSDSEFIIYTKALTDFNERLSNTKKNKIKKFAESGLGLSAMRFAKSFANPHKQPNLYKSIYKIVSNYQYDSNY